MPKLTVKDLFNIKGTRPLAQVYIRSPQEAAACQESGVDMVVTSIDEGMTRAVRESAPHCFFYGGPGVRCACEHTRVTGKRVSCPRGRCRCHLLSAGA